MIVCEPCGRRRLYNVQRLLAQYGDAKMPDLLTVLPNCPQGSASQSPELESCCCVFGLGGAQR
jgi:hypothetical protein